MNEESESQLPGGFGIVGQRRVVDGLMPGRHGQLTRHHGGTPAVGVHEGAKPAHTLAGQGGSTP
jgi:hypothetical protein